MFMGEYSHSVDTKGRLIMPAKFREQLGTEFVVTKGLDCCLYVYSQTEWRIIEENFHSKPRVSANERKFSRFFFGGAASMELDSQGRILLPTSLRSYAQFKKDVVLVGVDNKIEIWDKELYEKANSYEDMDEVAEQLADLGVGI